MIWAMPTPKWAKPRASPPNSFSTLSTPISETSKGSQGGVQWPQFVLHALSFLPPLLDDSSQARHGSPQGRALYQPSEIEITQTPFPTRITREVNTDRSKYPWDSVAILPHPAALFFLSPAAHSEGTPNS
jgi:hypothetical protein